MSIATGQEEFDMGIMMCHDRLIEAVKTYKQFLTTFGTCEDMTVADQLEELTHSILRHDRTDQKEIRPFRHGEKSKGDSE